MRRMAGIFALLVSASLLLAACDKCGGIQDIRLPGRPAVCSDGARG